MTRTVLFAAMALGFVVAPAWSQEPEPVSFRREIRPLLAARCFGCHQPARDEGDYVMTGFESLLAGGASGDSAIVPGDPDGSYLLELITPDGGVAEMPPEGEPLTADEIEQVRRWIAEGATNDDLRTAPEFGPDHPPQYRRRPNITALDVSPDGKWLAVNGFHEILLFPAELPRSVQPAPRRLIGLSPRIESIQFSPDSSRLAASGGRPGEMGEIQIWNVASGNLERSLSVSADTAYGISWSPDGKLVSFGLTDTSVRAIDVQSGEQVLYQGAHEDWVRDSVFSVDGSQLVSVGRDMTCKLIEVPTQRFIDNITSITPGVLKGGIAAVARHPERDEIVIGGADGIPKVYRMNRITNRVIGDDANLVRLLPAMTGRIQAVAVSADGKLIAAGSSLNGAGEVKIFGYEFDPAVSEELKKILEKQPTQWSAEERNQVDAYHSAGVTTLGSATIETSSVYAVDFHPSGSWLAAAGSDGQVRFLDPQSGSELGRLDPVPLILPAAESERVQWNFALSEVPAPPEPLFAAGDDSVSSLQVSPAEIRFTAPTDYAQLVVEALLPDGTKLDVTDQVSLSADPEVVGITHSLVQATGVGETELVVSLGGLNYSIPVSVQFPADEFVPQFRRDVNPILTRLGCNAGTCHGSANGKMGFKLSLRGYDPLFDVRAFTDDMGSRRVNLASPQDSLMLLKPTAGVPHQGGQLIPHGSRYYEILRGWIRGGATLERDPAKVESLEVYPPSPVLADAGWRQQMRVVATWSDGTRRDVTREAFLEVADLEIARAEGSVLTALRRGETPVLVRYEGAFTAANLTVMGDRSGFVWETPETWTEIDRLVARKWEVMKIRPAGLCTDAEFLRRVSLDLTGLPPTAEEVTAFLADSRPTRIKREEVIGTLIGSEPFVEHWSNKWADLMQVNRKYLGSEGATQFREWLREQVRENRPYDQFVHDVLTASGSNRENPAASYYKIHRTPEEAMENTTHLFLATRFNCNKCHDHPFERWTQDQYYETAAFFAQVQRTPDPASGDRRIGGSAVESATPLYEIVADAPEGDIRHERTGEVALPEFPFDADFELADEASRRARLAAWLTSPDNPYFATSYVNRLWGYLMGVGLIEPLDDIRAGNPPSNPELLEYLRREFVASGFDTRHVIRLICQSRVYQLSIATNPYNEDDFVNYSHALARRLPAEVLYDSLHAVTGSPLAIPGVPAGTRAAALPDSGAKLPSGFLSTLGRPARESVCECERGSELQLGSVLALVSGPDVSGAISHPGNAIETLVAAEPDDRELVNQLYLRVLNRPATDAERDQAVVALEAVREDHNRLIAARDRRREEVAAELPGREQQRLTAIDAAQQELEQRIAEIDPQLLEREQQHREAINRAQAELDAYLGGGAAFERWKEFHLRRAQWQPLQPARFESAAGRPFEIRDDRSVQLQAQPGKDTYTLVGQTNLAGITQLRLELLPDERLPGGGPGLAENGNLVLTELTVEIAHPDHPEQWLPVPLESGLANFSQNGFAIEQVIDGQQDNRQGWALMGNVAKVNWATFRMKLPVGYADGTLVRVRLFQQFDDRHQVGRFRVSLSQSSDPVGLGLPESLTAALAALPDDPAAIQPFEALFRQGDPGLRERQQALDAARQPLTIDPRIVAAREKLERVSRPLAADPLLERLERDFELSQQQLENARLTAAQDLTWALVNSPSFLFNH